MCQDATQGLFFFKQSLTSLNSEFSFFKTSYHTKVKELSLPYYLLIAEEKIVGFIAFSKVMTVKCQQPCPRFELGLSCPFPTTINIIPQMPPYISS